MYDRVTCENACLQGCDFFAMAGATVREFGFTIEDMPRDVLNFDQPLLQMFIFDGERCVGRTQVVDVRELTLPAPVMFILVEPVRVEDGTMLSVFLMARAVES